MSLPVPANMPARFETLRSVLEGVAVPARVLGIRWSYSDQTLSNARTAGKGLPWFETPTGGIRYRLSEILAAELVGTRGPLSVERVALELEAMPEVTAALKVAIVARLTSALRGPT